MARNKKNEFDFELDDDFDFDLDSFDDFEGDLSKAKYPDKEVKTKGDRKPADSKRAMMGAVLQSTKSNLTKAVGVKIAQSNRKLGSLASEVTGAYSDLSYAGYEFRRDLEPSLNSLRNAGRFILPKVRSKLPKRMGDKISSYLEKNRNYEGGSSDYVKESRDAALSDTLASIFQANSQQDREEAAVDKAIDRTLDNIRHKEISGAITDIRSAMLFQTNFTKSIHMAYLKKSLELQYRHLWIAEDQLTTNKLSAEMLEKKLSDIVHNTGLPDIQKKKMSESYKEVFRSALGQPMAEYVSNFSRNVVKNIKTKVFDTIKEGIEGVADVSNMVVSSLESAEDMAEAEAMMGGKKSKLSAGGHLIADLLGGVAASNVGGYAVRKAQKYVGPYMGDLDKFAGHAKLKGLHRLRKLKDRGSEILDNPDDKIGRNIANSGLEFLLSLVPDMDVALGLKNNLATKPTEEVGFDLGTRQSIVEIIPGLLGRILQQVTTMATGEPAPELVYDVHKRDFVTTSEFQHSIYKKAFGDQDYRDYQIGEAIGVMRGALYHHGHGPTHITKFDELTGELEKVILNHAKDKIVEVSPKDILEVANGTPLNECSDYAQTVFKGVKNPAVVARYMTHSLFRDSDDTGAKTINNNAVLALEKVIADIAMDEGYISTFADLFEGMGYARHLKPFLNKDMKFDRDKIYDQIWRSRKDEHALASAIQWSSESTKRELDTNLREKLKMSGKRGAEFLDKIGGKAASLTKLNEHEVSAVNFGGTFPTSGPVTNLFGQVNEGPAPLRGWERPQQTSATGTAIKPESPVEVKISNLAELLPSMGRGGIGGDGASIVDAITRFEKTFIDYTEREDKQTSILENISEHTRSSTDRLDTYLDLFRNWTAELREKGMGAAGEDPKRTWRNRWGDVGILGNIIDGGFGLAKAGVGGLFNTSMASSKMMTKLGLGAISGGTKLLGGTLGLGASILPTLIQGGFDISKLYLKGVGKAAGMTFGAGKSIAHGLFSKIGGAEDPFIDVYRKGEIEPGKPLLSASKQRKGVLNTNGKLLKNSFDIDGPILDADSGETLITEEDIETGLVDIKGNDINDKLYKKYANKGRSLMGSALFGGASLFGKVVGGDAKGIGNFFTGRNPIWNVYAKMLGLGTDIVGAGAKGGMALIRRLFGFKDKGDGSGGDIGKKDLEKIIGKRLDEIISILDPKSKRRQFDDDTDDDGIRDGSYQDYLKKKKEKKAGKDKAASGEGSTGPDAKKGGGLLGALASLFKGKEGEEGGLLGTLLGGAASGGLMSKAGGLLRGAGGALGRGALALGGAVAGSAALPWVLGGAAVAGAGYLAYRYLKPDEAKIEFDNIRLNLYGIDRKFGSEMCELEAVTNEILKGQRGQLTDAELEQWTKTFGLDPKDPEQVKYFATWYQRRFMQIYPVVNSVANNLDTTIDNAHKLEPKKYEMLLRKVKQEANPIAKSVHTLTLNSSGAASLKKNKQAMQTTGKTEADMDLGPKSDSEARRDQMAVRTMSSTSKYAPSTYDEGVAKTMAKGTAIGAGSALSQYDDDIKHGRGSTRKSKDKKGGTEEIPQIPSSDLMERTKQWIKGHEGLVLHNYKDSLGYDTIGYGHLNKEGYDKITKDQADALFDQDFGKHYAQATKIPEFQTLDPVRQSAMVNMVYNLGPGGVMKFGATRAAMRQEDWDGVKRGIQNSAYARQVGPRASEVAKVFVTGDPKDIKPRNVSVANLPHVPKLPKDPAALKASLDNAKQWKASGMATSGGLSQSSANDMIDEADDFAERGRQAKAAEAKSAMGGASTTAPVAMSKDPGVKTETMLPVPDLSNTGNRHVQTDVPQIGNTPSFAGMAPVMATSSAPSNPVDESVELLRRIAAATELTSKALLMSLDSDARGLSSADLSTSTPKPTQVSTPASHSMGGKATTTTTPDIKPPTIPSRTAVQKSPPPVADVYKQYRV